MCLCVAVLLTLVPALAAAEKAPPNEATFEMRGVSAIERSDIRAGRFLTLGQYAECSTEPDKAVKAFPKLKSKRPLYGKVTFDRNIATGSGLDFRFVLDESGEAPPEKAKADDQPKTSGEKSLLTALWEKLTGAEPKDARVEPAKPNIRLSRYDRLYFDRNRDLDLTNDPVLKPMKDAPWQALPPWNVQERMAFEYLDVDIDYGAGMGIFPFRVLPWFASMMVGTDGSKVLTSSTMYFVATMAREGRIRIGKHEYDALMAQPYGITGRFDRPITALYLKPINPEDKLERYGFVQYDTRELYGEIEASRKVVLTTE